MRKRFARILSAWIVRRTFLVALGLLTLTGLSAWRASKLHINNNQIDLISDELPAVKATKQMLDILGSVGHLIIALESDNEVQLKQTADDLAQRLAALPETTNVTYRQDEVSFVRERIGLYAQTDDLEEGYRRVKKKVKEVLRKNNPFHFELVESKEEPLELGDLLEKYKSFNKKRVDDPYYVDADKRMLLLVIKPAGTAADLEATRQLLQKTEAVIATYNRENSHGIALVEHYDGQPKPPSGTTVTYGYTGNYKTSLDDSDTIAQALVPTSAVALIGIFLYLMVTLRRLLQVMLIVSTLVAGITMSFAFCELVIGELNTVTAMLGAILMGLGIDYGIHFMYRFREEYSRSKDLEAAISETIEHSGSASLTSALTTAAALFVLTLAEFKGFSHFGLIAGMGILITCTMTYVAIPTFYVLGDKWLPSMKNGLVVASIAKSSPQNEGAYPLAKGILVGTVALSLVLAVFAFQVEFDYDSRSISATNRPSTILQAKINERFGISTDPVGIYTERLEDAKALYDKLTPVAEDAATDSVISLFTMIPSQEQQRKNREILQQLKKDLEPIKPEMLEEDQVDAYQAFLPYLDAEPFTLDELPAAIRNQFVPSKRSGYEGYLTFVYPKTSLWDGRELFAFADEVGTIELGDKVFHSAGMAVLYAELARMVLADGKRLTALAALFIFLIILATFRSVRAAVISMLPLVAGMMWMLGLMALTGWKINFMNIVVFPVVFGYGISCGVHLFHRMVESGNVMAAVRRTGSAVAASCITTLIGWGALGVSNHKGLESMGILACFGIASALVVSLTVLPALLQVWPAASASVRRPRSRLTVGVEGSA